MEIGLTKKEEFLIIAETEFERSFCKLVEGKIFVAKLKTGLSPADIVGIKFVPQNEKTQEEIVIEPQVGLQNSEISQQFKNFLDTQKVRDPLQFKETKFDRLV